MKTIKNTINAGSCLLFDLKIYMNLKSWMKSRITYESSLLFIKIQFTNHYNMQIRKLSDQ